MSESVESIVEGLKDEKKFDLKKALEKTTYPTGEVTVYLDGYKAYEIHEIAEKLLDLRVRSAELAAQHNGGITDSPEKEEVDSQIEALEAREKELIEEVKKSGLTFHMRGVAPAVWRAIDKKWRAKIRPDSQSEFDINEANMERNERVNNDTIAHAIVKVVAADGSVDASGWTEEQAGELFGVLLQPEWLKLKNLADKLTFAETLFEQTVETDADFLPQP